MLCYFFRNSDFHRYRSTIDAAVAARIAGNTVTFKLCLNPLSPNYEELKVSPFASRFKVVEDPIQAETDGDAYVVDGEIDRGDIQGVLKYLQEKYKTALLMNMDVAHVVASVSVPKNES